MFHLKLANGLAIGLLVVAAATWWTAAEGLKPQAVGAQEAKRYFYKIVDVPPDNAAMQATLNEYGAAGWELVVIGMGDMTTPRLIFKK
ncbi:MAG TPA: hypothetical protein VIU63_06250 [Nitrospira sp.]